MMNERLQKKCVIASTGIHGSLLVVLLVGSAFFPNSTRPTNPTKPQDESTVDVFAPGPIEKELAGRPESEVTSAPRTGPRFEQQEAAPEKRNDDPPPKRQLPQIDLTLRSPIPPKRSSPPGKPGANNNTTDLQQRDYAEDVQKLIGGSIANLNQNLSPGTRVGIPGTGDAAASGYENFIQRIYQAEYRVQLKSNGDVGERQSEVGVSVTVRRDGTVISSRVTQPSGNAAFNKLVQRVLSEVNFIGPFPKTLTDDQRTFAIVFELKPKTLE